MGAITALLNPNDKTKILVFYLNKNNSPAFRLLPADSNASSSQVFDSTLNTTSQTGQVVNPSCLASLFTDNLVTVIGITTPKTTTPASTKLDISVVSPVYTPLSQTESGNTSLAMCKSSDTAYVYYLTGTDRDKRKVLERTFTIASTFNAENDVEITDCLPNSKLAAYYDGSNRFLIYQGNETGNDFREYSKNSDTKIDTSKVLKQGPLTAVYVSKSSKTYLYYIDKNYKIRRIIKSSASWGDSSSFSDNEADASSDITAVYSPDYDLVHVLFFAKGSLTISHLKDNVKST